ncbi:MAG: hypothetical protein QF898_04970 [SAR202 cluster bacterium]|nr:hypothetical protein [SAR202 cluster bacterium]MDP6716787.1 hypothetical protein [SAR202 cluster bacterium]
MTRRAFWLSMLGLVALACSTVAEEVEPTVAVVQETAEISERLRPDEIPLIEGPRSEDGLHAIFATPDLGVGKNRFAFVLVSDKGLIRAPTAAVSSFYLPEEGAEREEKQTAMALFHPFPYVSRGIYTSRLTFDKPGRWGIEARFLDDDGAVRNVELFFDVAETTSAPALGAPAIRSHSKTLDDVERLTQISTGSMQDPDLYQLTIAEATESGLPTVIVMASPAFCTNAVCGPQVETLQQLKDEFEGQANFIHVDFYDNPEEIQGDLSQATLSPTVLEWNLPSTEWSFVVDRDGIVTGRFESFTPLEELRIALKEVL